MELNGRALMKRWLGKFLLKAKYFFLHNSKRRSQLTHEQRLWPDFTPP